MSAPLTCGEATIKLLAAYGVKTVFGIPGVHTLDFCQGLNKNYVAHIQARNEQGAGFMAEGYARATGLPGVALVISGPGVTNAITALGQCYADSLPMLLLSAEPPLDTLGKGRGVLHEITEQRATTAPVTALSATALKASDVPELIAQAFTIFASERPRPVHISVPIDVQAELVETPWQPVKLPIKASAMQQQIEDAVALLEKAKRPLIIAGGGAVAAGPELLKLVERTGAIFATSIAAKGVISDSHPQSISAAISRQEGHDVVSNADCVLAVGTELSDTDGFIGYLPIKGRLIRIDIAPNQTNKNFLSDIGIVSDAKEALRALLGTLQERDIASIKHETLKTVEACHTKIRQLLNPSERKHAKVLDLLKVSTSKETVFSADACQIAYTGAAVMSLESPRQWFFPAGYCALGNALPNAIGSMFAFPNRPHIVLVGDGGFMFTVQELMVAREHALSLPILIWNNGGYKQIRDDMDHRGIKRIAVEGKNPDFLTLAKAFDCFGVRPGSDEEFIQAVQSALKANKPTLIEIEENSEWLMNNQDQN